MSNVVICNGLSRWTRPPARRVVPNGCRAHYDYAAFKRELLRGLPGRPNSLWRYHDVLPIVDSTSPDLVVAGGTPLRPSWRYAAALGGLQVYLKDERLQPTGSFKDRQAAVSAAAMLEAGIHECVIASTGNAAVAYAAACARAGIKLWVFMTSLVPQAKMREAALFGAEVIKVSGTYEQAKQIAADFAQRRHLFYDRGARSLAGARVVQDHRLRDRRAAGLARARLVFPVRERRAWPTWRASRLSRIVRDGPDRSDPSVSADSGRRLLAHDAGLQGRTRCGRRPLSRKPASPFFRPVIRAKRTRFCGKRLQRFGGTFESVSDKEAWTAMQTLARTEGMAVEPATAVAFAGLENLTRRGDINRDDLVVVNCTGHTFPVEKHVLGDQWRVDIDLADNQQPPLRDGLLAALDRLDENVTTVLIVDDNADDALLVRRLLEAKKSYRVFHALDGQAGLAEARQRLPDLVVLDLTMPNLDGFSVLEELKRDERTRHIPVIVVTARDITEAERQRLTGRVEAFYQKAALSPRAFVDQVVHVLDVKTGRDEER